MWVGESGLEMNVVEETDEGYLVNVQRRVVDKKTGEVKVETRERMVPYGLWDVFTMGYEEKG